MVRPPLTREEAQAAGYEGYAVHMPHLPCPSATNPKVYCASCVTLMPDDWIDPADYLAARLAVGRPASLDDLAAAVGRAMSMPCRCSFVLPVEST